MGAKRAIIAVRDNENTVFPRRKASADVPKTQAFRREVSFILSEALSNFSALLQSGMDALTALVRQNPLVGVWYTTVVRFVLPVLGLMILVTAIRSLLSVKHTAEVWAYLCFPGGRRIPLTHWENIIGRQKNADVVIDDPAVSRTHAALIRQPDDTWLLYDLESTSGTYVGSRTVPPDGCAPVAFGDELGFADITAWLEAVSPEEKQARRERRAREDKPVSPWGLLVLMTFFQVLTCIQLVLSTGERAHPSLPLIFVGMTALPWIYCLTLRAFRRVGFEMEMIAFFLCTISLAVTASFAPASVPKQFGAIVLGLVGFLILGWFLRDLGRAEKVRGFMAVCAVGLLALTLLIGHADGGAKNWIRLGGMSLQPSELAKVCYIFAGSATLDRLFRKRNFGLFLGLTMVCLGCLALMNDFGAAAIFFVTFLVIAFLRSGDWAVLSLICGACGAGLMALLAIKPHIARRFAIWGHVWEDVYDKGFQQSHSLSAAASGGLVGVGAGDGWLNVTAADTDMVFCKVCEEWGLIIAVLAVLSIVTLAVFAVRACRAGRSSFYTIAACAATSLMVFQTCLNVFGAVDLLPLTGVTFPFVSNGGTSMLASWGMLAFLKASDTRQNASFAIRLPSRRELRREREEAEAYAEY